MSTTKTITNSIMTINTHSVAADTPNRIIDLFSGHNGDIEGLNGKEYLSIACKNNGYSSDIDYIVNRLYEPNFNLVQLENTLDNILEYLKCCDSSMRESFLTKEVIGNNLVVSFVCVIEC